jgi:hypothetical protein
VSSAASFWSSTFSPFVGGFGWLASLSSCLGFTLVMVTPFSNRINFPVDFLRLTGQTARRRQRVWLARDQRFEIKTAAAAPLQASKA